jgi:transcriptional regulator with XRE-family HTH domain
MPRTIPKRAKVMSENPSLKRRPASVVATATAKGPPHAPGSIPARIRSIRRQRHITLERLSDLTTLDRGYLSRVERGHKTPSIAALLKIASALDVQMAHLFGETVGSSAITLVRHKDYQSFPGPKSVRDHVLMMVLPQSQTRRLSVVVISPGPALTAAGVEHPGEEMLFVMQGQVEVRFADRNITLSGGDCVHFDGHLNHAIRRIGKGRARALVVIGQDLSDVLVPGTHKIPPAGGVLPSPL